MARNWWNPKDPCIAKPRPVANPDKPAKVKKRILRVSKGRADAFLHTKKWKEFRKSILKTAGSCDRCRKSAIGGVRLDVRHVKPLATHWESRMAPAAVHCLCGDCIENEALLTKYGIGKP